MKKLSFALGIALTCFVAAPVAAQSSNSCDASGSSAQTCTLSVPVDVTVEHVLHLEVSETVTHFGSVGVDAFTNGPTITLVANTDWDLNIASRTPTFLRNGQPSSKSISTLYTVRNNQYTEMSTTGFALSSGSAGFITVPSFQYYVYTDVVNDAPGDYSAEIVFTLVGR